jgi:transposase InsO family protein
MNSHRVTRRMQIGAYLGKGESIYRIVSFGSDNLTILVSDENTGFEHTVTLQTILDGEYRYASDPRGLLLNPSENDTPPRIGLPKALLDKAEKMVRIVEGFEAWMAAAHEKQGWAGRRSQELANYVIQQDISVATFYNYRRAYQAGQGDAGRIAANLRRSSYGKKRLTRAQQHFLDMIILRYPTLDAGEIRRYGQALLERTGGLWVDPERCDPVPDDLVQALCNPKISIDLLLNHPEKRPLLVSVSLPGKTAFYEYYNALTAQPDRGQIVVDQRYGEGTWDRQLRAFDTFVHRAVEPLQYVFLDHYLLDVFVVDELTRRQRDRLWLTTLIDAYTRSVLGFALLYEAPSIESVQSALQQAIWPKTQIAEGEWKAYGVPVQLSLDNAWAHHAHSLESLARDPELRIDLVYRPVYQGRYGALIERYFGNLAGRLQQRLKNAGAIVSREPKDIGNAARTACLLYDDLYHFILEEVVTYQNTPHRELNGLTPNQKWEKEEQEHGIITPPSQTPALLRKFWREYNGKRPLTEKGLCLFGMHYQSPDLRHLPRLAPVARVDHGKKTQHIQYTIRFNPHDISRIAVFDGIDYVGDAYASQLRLPDGTYLALSLAERELAKAMARERNSADIGRDWVHYLDHLKTTVKTRQAEKRRAHRLNTDPADVQVVVESDRVLPGDGDWLAQTDEALDAFWTE